MVYVFDGFFGYFGWIFDGGLKIWFRKYGGNIILFVYEFIVLLSGFNFDWLKVRGVNV